MSPKQDTVDAGSRKLGYAYVPFPRAFVGVLRAAEQAVWVAIASHAFANNLERIKLGERQLAEDAGLSRSQARRALSILIAAGVVAQERLVDDRGVNARSVWALGVEVDGDRLAAARVAAKEKRAGGGLPADHPDDAEARSVDAASGGLPADRPSGLPADHPTGTEKDHLWSAGEPPVVSLRTTPGLPADHRGVPLTVKESSSGEQAAAGRPPPACATRPDGYVPNALPDSPATEFGIDPEEAYRIEKWERVGCQDDPQLDQQPDREKSPRGPEPEREACRDDHPKDLQPAMQEVRRGREQLDQESKSPAADQRETETGRVASDKEGNPDAAPGGERLFGRAMVRQANGKIWIRLTGEDREAGPLGAGTLSVCVKTLTESGRPKREAFVELAEALATRACRSTPIGDWDALAPRIARELAERPPEKPAASRRATSPTAKPMQESRAHLWRTGKEK